MSKESARASAEHRKAVVAAAKAAEQRRRRRGRAILIAVAVVVVAGVVALVLVVTRPAGTAAGGASPTAKGQIVPATPSGPTTVEQAATPVKDTSGIAGVLAWDTTGWPGDGSAHAGALEHSHVDGPVTYSVLPPVGGPHNATWMNAGVYTKPVPTERAVHNLEHGAIWITYNPDLAAADVAQLTAFVTRQTLIPEPSSEIGISGDTNRYMDLSPWATNSLPSQIVISAWGHQLRVTSATDPRLQQFVDTFRHNQKYSPEFGAAVDGIPVQTGGRAALDGGTKPNPPGAAS
jgi:hypothetical protein